MRLAGRVASLLAAGGILLAAAAGVLVGLRWADAANVPQQQTLTIASPEGAEDTTPPVRSAGGFTGFEGLPALAGEAVRSGRISDVTEGGFAVTSDDGALSVVRRGGSGTYRIAPLEGGLATGDPVMLRIDASGTAAAALRIATPVAEASATEAPAP